MGETMKYKKSVMFEMMFAALQRNTVYQRLCFEQRQAGRKLSEEEIEKIWKEEIDDMQQHAVGVEDDVKLVYGEEAEE